MNKCKKIILCTIAYLTLLSSAIIVKAELFSGGFASGVLTVGTGAESNVETTKIALEQWNGVVSKVKLTHKTYEETYDNSIKIVSEYDLEKPPITDIVTEFGTVDPPTAGLLGIMVPYKDWTYYSASPAELTDRWVKAVVYQYKNPELDTSTKKIATAAHELGHALSIGHPPINTEALMQQGVKTSYSLKEYDKKSLIRRWNK